ncbi:unnamed protein product [Lathyrus sativus]|nr:unnamed protein product [Lathyrus sativus]
MFVCFDGIHPTSHLLNSWLLHHSENKPLSSTYVVSSKCRALQLTRILTLELSCTRLNGGRSLLALWIWQHEQCMYEIRLGGASKCFFLPTVKVVDV